MSTPYFSVANKQLLINHNTCNAKNISFLHTNAKNNFFCFPKYIILCFLNSSKHEKIIIGESRIQTDKYQNFDFCKPRELLQLSENFYRQSFKSRKIIGKFSSYVSKVQIIIELTLTVEKIWRFKRSFTHRQCHTQNFL